MASGPSQRSGRASKAPKRFDFIDPDIFLILGDEEAGVESLSVLDCRDNDPEMDESTFTSVHSLLLYSSSSRERGLLDSLTLRLLSYDAELV